MFDRLHESHSAKHQSHDALSAKSPCTIIPGFLQSSMWHFPAITERSIDKSVPLKHFLIIDFFVIRDMKGPLSQIRVSLVASLGAGQIIFLAGIGATENKVKRFKERQ